MIRALIFDFDGLILDTEAADYNAWNELFGEHGTELPVDVWVKSIGSDGTLFDPVAFLEDRLGRGLDGAGLRARQRARHLELVSLEEARPGVLEYIREARRRGLLLGVASNGSRAWVTGRLRHLGLTDWDVIRCRDDVSAPKPAPDVYLAACEALGVLPAEAIAFEDSPTGALAAKHAGLFCVAVPHALTAALDLTHADVEVQSLAELPLSRLLQAVDEARV